MGKKRFLKSKVFISLALALTFSLLFIGISTPDSNQISDNQYSRIYIPTFKEYNYSFSNPSNHHYPTTPVVAYDLDNDSTSELVVGSENGWIYIFEGDNNSYSLIWSQDLGILNPDVAGIDQIFSIAIGDVDLNTSSIEVVVGTIRHISFLTWNGTGLEFDRYILISDSDVWMMSSLLIDDVDYDGYNEVVTIRSPLDAYCDPSATHRGRIYIWDSRTLNTYSGNWGKLGGNFYADTRSEVNSYSWIDYASYTVIFGDPDNDGINELVIHAEDALGSFVFIVYNIGSGWVIEWYSFYNFPVDSWGAGYGLAIGDFDNDGDNELVIGENDGTIYLLKSKTVSDYSLIDSIVDKDSSYIWGLKIFDSDDDSRNELIATSVEGYLIVFQWDSTVGIRAENPVFGFIGAQLGAFNNIGIDDFDNDTITEMIVVKAGPETKWGFTDPDTVTRLFIFGCITSTAYLLGIGDVTVSGGQIAYYDVQYNRTDLVPSIGILGLGQVVALDNSTQNLWVGGPPSFIENGNGNYTIEVSTIGVTTGTYTLKIILFKSGFCSGAVYVNLTVTAIYTNIDIVAGGTNISGYWETYNFTSPYVNDTQKDITICYNISSSLEGLAYASLKASIKTLTGSLIPGKEQLPWIDLYALYGGSENKGKYNITMDAVGLHIGDYNLTITVQKEGYAPGEIWVLMHVEPIPSMLVISDSDLTLFEGQSYTLSVLFRDDYFDKDIPNGFVNYNIVNSTHTIGGNVTNIAYGLYQVLVDFDSLNIITGNYNFSIVGIAEDYQDAEFNITLTISDKINVILQIWGLPNELDVGASFTMLGSLTFTNGTGIPDQTIIFTINYGSSSYERTAITDGTGDFTITDIVPSGATGLSITAKFDGSQSLNFVTSNVQTASVYTMVDRILSFAPFIGAGLAAIAGGALGYHRGVVIPRRKRKITKLEESTAVLRDLVNIQHIFVLQKESGLTIYDRAFSRIPLDPALVSGFIQAISSFGTELTESKEGTLKELTHENFTILINPGEYTMTALILSDHPSKKLRENIANFKSVFESQYQEKLIKWSGELKEFKGANEIVDQVFEFNLLKPQIISETKLKSARLNDLQKDIIKLTNEILSANQTFNIVNLLNISLTMRKEDKLEIIDAVYKLAKTGIIKPYEPTSTDESDLYI